MGWIDPTATQEEVEEAPNKKDKERARQEAEEWSRNESQSCSRRVQSRTINGMNTERRGTNYSKTCVFSSRRDMMLLMLTPPKVHGRQEEAERHESGASAAGQVLQVRTSRDLCHVHAHVLHRGHGQERNHLQHVEER